MPSYGLYRAYTLPVRDSWLAQSPCRFFPLLAILWRHIRLACDFCHANAYLISLNVTYQRRKACSIFQSKDC
jgi:hypothetical protein